MPPPPTHLPPAHLTPGAFAPPQAPWWVACSLLALAGTAWMGLDVLKCIAATWLGAVLAGHVVLRQRPGGMRPRVSLPAVLCALTLPPGALPLAAFGCGALVALAVRIIGSAGGDARELPCWNPAMLARVIAQCLFGWALALHPAAAAPAVLSTGHVFFGAAGNAVMPAPGSYDCWRGARPPMGAHAWLLPRTTDVLRNMARDGADDHTAMLTALRDSLPAWEDLMIGGTPGECGSTSAGMLVVAILYLMHKGMIRVQLVAGALLAAFIAALVLPTRTAAGAAYEWFPGWVAWNGIPIGLMYVIYHLVCGQLLLAIVVAASDPSSLPVRRRSQFVCGLGIGAGIIFMRLHGIAAAEAAWPILLMNTLARPIDWLMSTTVRRSTSNIARRT